MFEEHKALLNLQKRFPRYFKMEERQQVDTPDGLQHMFQFSLTDHSVRSSEKPAVGLFAGVHGIEAIGVKILVSYLEFLLEQVSWNLPLADLLKQIKIVGIPIVNPFGFAVSSRCNENGVDLMRNAPVESPEQNYFVGGHRISNMLPYYRGNDGWEVENQVLLDVVRYELWNSPFSVSLDLHSGFGVKDFLWCPYAKKRGLPPTWPAYQKMKIALDNSHRHHIYRFEAQSESYLTSGDVWDFLHDEFLESSQHEGKHFLPLTLEVGSWVWIKKSPLMAYKLKNFFNPAHPHREQRTLRRHRALLEFLMHVAASHETFFAGAESARVPSRYDTLQNTGA